MQSRTRSSETILDVWVSIARATRRQKIWISIAAACVLTGGFFLFWRGAMPFEGLMRTFARFDRWDQAVPLASNPATLRRCYALSVGTALLLLGLLGLAGAVWARLNEEARDVIYRLTITLASSCALMIYLFRMEQDDPWAPVSAVMKNPSALPIYGHRLLFVWMAKGFQVIVPHLSDLRGFYLAQFVAAVLAMYALGKWSALHIGKAFGWMGQIIGVVLISTCFSYHNFYDIGVVFFTTCGLIAFYTRRYWWMVPIVVIATLNHEGVLLLIPIVAYMAYGDEPARKWIPAIAASLVGYCAVRIAMQAAIPFPHQMDLRIWSNMAKPFVLRTEMAYSVLALAGWYAAGLMSVPYCDARLRRLILCFPLLLGETFLVGQFQEARQFDAFIPVLVAMMLSPLKRKLEFDARAVSSAVR